MADSSRRDRGKRSNFNNGKDLFYSERNGRQDDFSRPAAPPTLPVFHWEIAGASIIVPFVKTISFSAT
jgi:hypothetical protein